MEPLLWRSDGNIIASKKATLNTPKKPFNDLDGFYEWLYFPRNSLAPLTEADKRVLSVFDRKRRHLSGRAGARRGSARPLISAIMPSYNRAARRERSAKLIIVDDGSTDESADVAKGFGDARAKLFSLGQRSAIGHARNVGLENASGELIAYLDSDNWWDEDHLAAMVESLASTPNCDAAYSGQYLYRAGLTQPFAFRAESFNGTGVAKAKVLIDCKEHSDQIRRTRVGV